MSEFFELMTKSVFYVASYAVAFCIYGLVLLAISTGIANLIKRTWKVIKESWQTWRNKQ